ncbi:hypothetical protein C8A05DRAFT_43509 [Staphylotrichum tortipilum]|uniref:Uncharacterized protein n=1 Tax=Staphylotrichum tortipilum TaxID=2831512 RepID=A0AAN6RUH4_9PEZI|nr:hypothetical protein C8A05DRAFT_43509 [Staphylotrichum longicolle]
MATAVIEVQTAKAKPDKDSSTVILNGAPKSEVLANWLRDILRARREPPTVQTRSALNPAANSTQSPANVAQAQNAVAAGIGILDVHVRLSVREKLQTLVFASAIGLKADLMADFTEQEVESLRQFQAAYDANRAVLFRGKPMPPLIFELVELKSDGTRLAATATPTTSICVKGLHSDDAIGKFHQAMSRSAIRRLYQGMRLSYDRTLIERQRWSPLGETMCGARLVTRRPGHKPWSSTIGGVVQVGDELYAMTSSHTPNDIEAAPGMASLADDSSSSTLVEAGDDDGVESALILDYPHQLRFIHGGEHAVKRGVPWESQHSLPDHSARLALEHGDDWRLVPVPLGAKNANTAARTYLTESLDTRPARRKVSILAGTSGLCRGTLLSSAAFLSIRGHSPAEKGDSGSWVVDDKGGWVGTVTATSGGSVYLLPAHVQLQQMRLDLGDSVVLPSPLRCYLELLSDPSAPPDWLNSFAAKALTPEVLLASASDMDGMALTLALARQRCQSSQEYEDLKMTIRRMGTEPPAVLEGRPLRLRLGPMMSARSLASPALETLRELYLLIQAERRTRALEEICKLCEDWKPVDYEQLPALQDPPKHDLIGSSKSYGTPTDAATMKEKYPETQIPSATLPHGEHGAEDEETKPISLGRVAALFLVNLFSVAAVGTLAGIAALAALLEVQPDLRQVLFSTSASRPGVVAALGPMTGFCLAAPLIWEDIVYFFIWTPQPLPPLVGRVMSYILLLAVAFARPLFAATVVSSLLGTDSSDIGGWRIAALAASAPFLFDTILSSRLDVGLDAEIRVKPGFFTSTFLSMLPNFMRVGKISALATYFIIMYPGCVAWDALAGYTFARVASNYGVGTISLGAAAAAGAVLGTVSHLSRPLAIAVINQLQLVLLGPVNQPRRQLMHGAVVRLVHERDVAVAGRAGRNEVGLALGGRLAVPVLRVDVVVDHLVAHRLEDGQGLARGVEVGRADVGGLLADDVDQRVFELRDLGADARFVETAQGGVGPAEGG